MDFPFRPLRLRLDGSVRLQKVAKVPTFRGSPPVLNRLSLSGSLARELVGAFCPCSDQTPDKRQRREGRGRFTSQFGGRQSVVSGKTWERGPRGILCQDASSADQM